MTLQEFLDEWGDPSPALLVHTSGSTGRPKPLRVEKQRMAASARTTCQFLGLRRGDTALLCMSLDYIAGKMMVVRSLEWGLHLLSVPPSGHPLAALPSAPGGHAPIAFAAMVPLQVYNSLQREEERRALMAIRHLIIGGGAVDEALVRQLSTFPHAVWSTYGMTETLSHIALRRLNGPEASPWYTPLEGVSVGTDAAGCLVIDAPTVCPTTLTTRDRAVLHPDGVRFRIVGRIDNVVQSGGLKLQIEELERALRPHLSAPFMLTKCQDPRLGEALVMLVASPDTSQAQAACRQWLKRYEQPRHFISVTQLPATATGKPARAEAMRLAGLELGKT